MARTSERYIAKLKEAKSALEAAPEPVWMSGAALIAASGLTRFKVASTPECSDYFRQIVETRTEYVDRALTFWMHRLADTRPMAKAEGEALRDVALQHDSFWN